MVIHDINTFTRMGRRRVLSAIGCSRCSRWGAGISNWAEVKPRDLPDNKTVSVIADEKPIGVSLFAPSAGA